MEIKEKDIYKELTKEKETHKQEQKTTNILKRTKLIICKQRLHITLLGEEVIGFGATHVVLGQIKLGFSKLRNQLTKKICKQIQKRGNNDFDQYEQIFANTYEDKEIGETGIGVLRITVVMTRKDNILARQWLLSRQGYNDECFRWLHIQYSGLTMA